MNERVDQSQEQAEPAASQKAPSQGGMAGIQEKESPAEPRLDRLPLFRVLLHNDDVNDMVYVVDTICDLTSFTMQRAATVMLEAHNTGVALLLLTHRERAELFVEQFASKGLTVTMERAD